MTTVLLSVVFSNRKKNSLNFHMYFDDSKLEKRRIWHVDPSDLIIKVLQDRQSLNLIAIGSAIDLCRSFMTHHSGKFIVTNFSISI